MPHSRGNGDFRDRSAVTGRLHQPRPDSATNAGRGVSFRRGIADHLGGPGPLGTRGSRRDRWTGNVPADAGAEVASGRASVFSSGGKQKRYHTPVCLYGDLYRRLRRGGTATTPAVAQGARAVRRGTESAGAHQAPFPCAAGGRALRMGAEVGGLWRHLSAHGVVGGTGLSVPAERTGARGEWHIRPAAGLVEETAPAASIGQNRDPDTSD